MGDGHDEAAAGLRRGLQALDYHAGDGAWDALIAAALRAAADAARAGQRRRDVEAVKAALPGCDSPTCETCRERRMALDAIERGAGRPEGAGDG